MSNEDVEKLSSLLDDALGDFKEKPIKPPKTSDDDLDDFLAPMDNEATQKAAKNFEKLLKEIAVPEAFEGSSTETKPKSTPDLGMSGQSFLTDLLGLNQFLDEEGAEPELRAMTEMFLKHCFTKDIILPIIRELHKVIGEHLADESATISEVDKNNLLAQEKVFAELVVLYERSGDQLTAEENEQINGLWAQLQNLGEIPAELMTKFEGRLQNAAGSGLPNMSALAGVDPSQCSLIMETPPNYRSYAERSFILHRPPKEGDVEYLRHPSGVIMILLAEGHPLLNKDIKEVDFDVSNKKNAKDRSKQIVSGKGKKGGLRLMPETKICLIKCADESVYTIRSGIKGTLIEVNSRLTTEPQLLKKSREGRGYIAIVFPNGPRVPKELGEPVRVGVELPMSSVRNPIGMEAEEEEGDSFPLSKKTKIDDISINSKVKKEEPMDTENTETNTVKEEIELSPNVEISDLAV